jgi:hypothetical protein
MGFDFFGQQNDRIGTEVFYKGLDRLKRGTEHRLLFNRSIGKRQRNFRSGFKTSAAAGMAGSPLP